MKKTKIEKQNMDNKPSDSTFRTEGWNGTFFSSRGATALARAMSSFKIADIITTLLKPAITFWYGCPDEYSVPLGTYLLY